MSEAEIPASNGEGWDFFTERIGKAMTEAAEQREMEAREIDRAFLRLFSTADGQIVLKHLELVTEQLEDFNPNLGFHNGAAYGFRRTGWRDHLKFIKNAIVRGDKS
jgi:hypothetical protein